MQSFRAFSTIKLYPRPLSSFSQCFGLFPRLAWTHDLPASAFRTPGLWVLLTSCPKVVPADLFLGLSVWPSGWQTLPWTPDTIPCCFVQLLLVISMYFPRDCYDQCYCVVPIKSHFIVSTLVCSQLYQLPKSEPLTNLSLSLAFVQRTVFSF